MYLLSIDYCWNRSINRPPSRINKSLLIYYASGLTILILSSVESRHILALKLVIILSCPSNFILVEIDIWQKWGVSIRTERKWGRKDEPLNERHWSELDGSKWNNLSKVRNGEQQLCNKRRDRDGIGHALSWGRDAMVMEWFTCAIYRKCRGGNVR